MTDGSIIKTTDYLDGFQYENQLWQFFPHSEGYVRVTTKSINPNNPVYDFNYAYNYTDHLGNIRMSYAKDPQSGDLKVMEENHYYPFGLKHQNYGASDISLDFQEQLAAWGVIIAPTTNNPFKYKYNGKEYQDELNLNSYAFGWRDYDPATTRFSKVDRFSEKYPNVSPYSYAANNPLRFTDVKGDSIWINFGKNAENRVLYQDGQLMNADGTQYTGDGVKIKKNGKVKIKNSFLRQSVRSLNKIGGTSTGGEMLAALQSSNYSFDIKHASFNPSAKGAVNEFVADNNLNATFFKNFTDPRAQGRTMSIGSGGTIYWNPTDATKGTLNVVGGTDFNPTTNLGHELGHGWDANFGLLSSTIGEGGLNIQEWRASYIENQLRDQLGAPLRSSYGTTNLLDRKNNPIKAYGTGNPTIDAFITVYSIQNVR